MSSRKTADLGEDVEGGAHQSVGDPLTGLTQPGLTAFERAYTDELSVLLRWAFEEIQRETGEFGLFPAVGPTA
jgi:pyruvate dehydrogenase complex dehydrogenase (E1) component